MTGLSTLLPFPSDTSMQMKENATWRNSNYWCIEQAFGLWAFLIHLWTELLALSFSQMVFEGAKFQQGSFLIYLTCWHVSKVMSIIGPIFLGLAVLWIIFVCKTPTSTPTSYYVINALFIISMCILTVLPPQKNPRALCWGAPPILYVRMFPWNFIFYQTRKKWGNKRRVVYVRRGSCTHAFSPGLGRTSGSHPWVPLPQENALLWEPLL
jgi:hypothetical protein